MSEIINNSQKRIETMAQIIKDLHAGKDTQAAKAKLADLVRSTTSEEIVAMEQQLMADGMSVTEIKSMCDLHSQVLGDIIEERLGTKTPPGHPLHTFGLENEAIAGVAGEMRELLNTLSAEDFGSTLTRWREIHERIMEVEKHYARKENILFPYLEQHGVTGPSQVMWGKDDDIRVMMKSLRQALVVEEASAEEWQVVVEQIAVPMLDQIEEMITKEERILFPMAQKKLTPEQWGAIYRDSARYGYCLVEPGTGYQPPQSQENLSGQIDGQRIPVGVGSLLPEQLQAIASVLPVDLTFVDADDRVAFFSEGRDRVFARPPAIIGRKVQNCHPPQSVDVVDKILADFRSGAQDVAEFWIDLRGRFVHIRYFAVRSEGGEYLGTLEVTQDLTGPRSLEGERRLLQYEDSR
jgi:DUF438 domain-containing protein